MTGVRGAASRSEELPADVFAPAPLQRSGQLTVNTEEEFLRSKTALLALYRVVAFGCGLSWLLFMGLGSHSAGLYRESLTSVPTTPSAGVFWLFTIMAVLVVVAGFVHRLPCYRWAMGLAGGSYLAVLLVHLGFLVGTGGSPLTVNYLGDYVGLPIALPMAVIPGRAGIILAMLAIAVAAAVNLSTPLSYNTLLEIAHAEILMLPFLMLLQAGHQTSAELDKLVDIRHRDTVRVARMRALGETETRFLGYVHDRVLSHLDGLWRGVVPVDSAPLDPRELLGAASAASTQLPLATVMSGMVAEARRIDPGLDVSFAESVPLTSTLPSDIAAVMSDALLEAVSNGRRHAPRSTRTLTITPQYEAGQCTGLDIRVEDDGPGFVQDKVPRSRAGIRVAIRGRMEMTPGCRAQVVSEPGVGTRVGLSWRRDGRDTTPDTAAGDISVPTPYGLVGGHRIFRPRNALIVFAVFVGLSLSNTHPNPWATGLALAAAAVALGALVQGDALRLPARPTALVAGASLAFLGAALVCDPPPTGHWPGLWWPWVFVLLCTYLAIRDRALVALPVWAAGGVLITVLPTEHFTAVDLAVRSVLLIPAALIPRMVDISTRGLGLAMLTERERATEVHMVTTRRAFLLDSTEWLGRQLRAALHPRLPAGIRRHNAHLLESRLRDSIRSPLFDVAPVTRAVWDARARGVQVRLLDDRSASTAVGDKPDLLAQTHADLLEELSGSVQQVTARIFPPGRSTYATIICVDESGETRRRVISAV